MKFFTPSALLVGALFSAAAVIPFLPATHVRPPDFEFEAQLRSSVDGNVQLYFDAGRGFQEDYSVRIPLARSDLPRTYRFALPPGIYTALRFDPIDRDGIVTISDPRIVDESGRVRRRLDLGEFKPAHEIESLRQTSDGLVVTVAPGNYDPQLRIDFDPALTLSRTWTVMAYSWFVRAAGVFAALALALFALDRFGRFQERLSAFARILSAKPRAAIAAVSAAAVVVSAYPVVFLGQSIVSPTLGTVLLYDAYPTLPGGGPDRTVDVKGADIGAIIWQHIPFSAIQHRSLLRDFELPLWNRYNSCGSVLLGQGQSMFGDPLHLLVVAADGAAWAWDIKYLAAKWLFAFGLGLIAFAVTRLLPASLIASLAAPFAGFFVFRINHPAYFSFCYAPWPLLCWVGIAHAKGARATAVWCAGLILANLALMNSGTVKEAYTLFLAMNFSGACVLLASAAPPRIRLAKFAGAAWAGFLFLLLTAPISYTFLETLRQSYTSSNSPSAFQVQPSLLLAAFDEALFRPLVDRGRVFDPSANFLVLGGLLYFLASLRSHFGNRTVMALAGSSLLPLGLAFGFIPSAWIERVPFLGSVSHIDNCFICALIVLWSVLSAAGFASAAVRLGSAEGRSDLVAGGLILFALVFGYVGFGHAVHRQVFGPGSVFSPLGFNETIPVGAFVWLYLATLIAALAGLAALARRALARRAVTAASGLGFALCTFALLWRLGIQSDAAGFENYVVRLGPRADFHAPSPAVQFALDADASEPARAVGLQNNLFPGWTDVYGVEGISGPDALMNPRYRELAGDSPLERIWDWRLVLSRNNLAAARPFLDFLNVRHYFDLKSDQAALGAVLKLDRTGDLDVYESPTVWPRAFFTDRLAGYGTADQLMQMILHGDGRPFAAMSADDLAGTSGLGVISEDLSGRSVVPASRYQLTENSTSFDIEAPAPGIAVLSEVDWPGDSHAEVDGRKVPVLRINHAFEGVLLDQAGHYRVTFRYRPRNFPLLLELSGVGFILLAGSGWAVWKRPVTAIQP